MEAWQRFDNKIVFQNPGTYRRFLKLRCGACIGCRLSRSEAWAIRCVNEASLHDRNCYITLTYDDDRLPRYGSLLYRDFQLFLKRLRKEFSNKDEYGNIWRLPIRFFMCGEYGDKNQRPHFHACLFGVSFPDMAFWGKSPSGSDLYRSPILERLWKKGFSSIGALTFESAAYVARYICKKVVGKDAELHYGRVDFATGEIYSLEPEFCQMSLKPGIGANWIKRYSDEVLIHDGVAINGSVRSVPKYYDTVLESMSPLRHGANKERRIKLGRALKADCTPARLAAQEIVTTAGMVFKKRSKV